MNDLRLPRLRYCAHEIFFRKCAFCIWMFEFVATCTLWPLGAPLQKMLTVEVHRFYMCDQKWTD